MSTSVAVTLPRQSTITTALMVLAATSTEWYDFFLYGTAAALVFPSLFFSKALTPLIALLASFSTFAVGFIARPLGAILFGHLGDRRGRRPSLALALATMGISTALIGCLPSYSAIGVFAPILLVFLRFAQGLAVGGQWGGAMLMITERVPEAQRGFYGSFAQAGVPVGVVLANLTFLLMGVLTSEEAVKVWAWRIPFLLSLSLGGLALLIHSRFPDSITPRDLTGGMRKAPALEALRRYPREILLASGTFIAGTLAFYVMLTFILAYGTSSAGLHLSATTMLAAVLIASSLQIVTSFLIGRMSDAIGYRRTIMLGALLSSLWAFSLFPLLNTKSFGFIVLALCMGKLATTMMYVPTAALVTGMFDKSVRCTAASLSYQIGSIFGGGLAPLIATALLARFSSGLGVMVYICVGCLITLLSVSLIREHPRNAVQQHAH
jgi:MFS family permease